MAVVPSSIDIEVSTNTTFTPFPTHICKELDIYNNTGVTIMIQTTINGVPGIEYKCVNNSYKKISGLENANQVAVKRESSTGAITVQATVYA